MDENRFFVVTRSLTSVPSRRDVLRGLVATGFGLGVSQAPSLTVAKKKRQKKKKAKPNAYGCRGVGVACTSVDQCCSGVCEGKKCRAHGIGICKQGVPGVCSASINDLPSLNCDSLRCFCYRTTAGSNFCSGGLYSTGENCADCKKDADCLALGYPPGSACAPVGQGLCAGFCETGTACLYPCGYEPPAQTPE